MEVVLQQINKIQGVVGSFICDEEGSLLSQALPPTYDLSVLQEAAGIIADGIIGVNNATGGIASFDLRFSEGRIIVRPVQSSFLLLLCEQKINVQLLNMSLSVALKKLEKAIQNVKDHPETLQVSKQTIEPQVVPESHELRRDGKGVILTVDSMYASSKLPWDQMKEGVAISHVLANDLCSIFRNKQLKKLKLTNRNTNKSKVFIITVNGPVAGQLKDDKLILTLAASEVLAAKPGDEITVESTMAPDSDDGSYINFV